MFTSKFKLNSVINFQIFPEFYTLSVLFEVKMSKNTSSNAFRKIDVDQVRLCLQTLQMHVPE